MEAVLLMLGVAVVGLGRGVDAAAYRRLLHPVGVSEVEATLKGALVFCRMDVGEGQGEEKIEARLDQLPPASMVDCFRGPTETQRRPLNCDKAIFVLSR